MKTDRILQGQSKGDRNATTDEVLPPDLTSNNTAAFIAATIRDEAGHFEEHRRFKIVGRGFGLLNAKASIPRGHFGKYVKDECHMSASAAQRAMQAARIVGKYDKLSYLPQHALLALAAP